MEPIYVGKGKDVRCVSHLKRRDIHPLTHRLRYMAKNDVYPIIKLIPCESEELAYLVEEEAINKYGRKDLGMGPLLNLTDGGEGRSAKHSERTKQKISAANKGKKRTSPVSDQTRSNISAALKGHAVTLETASNISIAKTGKKCKPFTDEHKAKIAAGRRKRPIVVREKRWSDEQCTQQSLRVKEIWRKRKEAQI